MKNEVAKILIECPELIPSVKLGVLDILTYLEKKKKCEVKFKRTIDIIELDIVWCDIVVTVRGSEYRTVQIIREAKKNNRKVIYFLDDDLLNIPNNTLSTQYYSQNDIKNNIIEIIKESDLFWCVNELIGKKYSEIGKVRWFQSKVPLELEKFELGSESNVIKILYAGSLDHFNIVSIYLVPAIKKLLDEYGDLIEVNFIGVDPKLTSYSNVKFYEYFNDYNLYKETVKNMGVDIGLAPIFTTEFYNMKYHNKFIEYTSIGAAGLYTDTPPYSEVIEDSKNGLLSRNTVDGWYENIKRLIDDRSLRERCIKNAESIIIENYNFDFVSKQVEESLDKFISYKAPKIREKDVILDSKWGLYTYKIRLILSEEGLIGIITILIKLLKKISRKVRKKK